MRYILPAAVVLVFPLAVWADPPGHIVQPKDGQFSVRFPGSPKESTHKTKTDLGSLTVYTATYALPDGSVFLASFTAYPEPALKADFRKSLFDGAIKGLAGKKGKVLEEKEIAIGSEKGREALIEKGKLRIRCRLVVKDNRLIQVSVLGTDEFISGKEATAYLDSFHFNP